MAASRKKGDYSVLSEINTEEEWDALCQRKASQHFDILSLDITTFSITTLSITTFSIMGLIETLSTNNT
jgi:hypothetical protein